MLQHYINEDGELRRIKDRYAAIIIAFGLGTFGIQKFYLGKCFWGIILLILSWTGIPTLVGIIEGILYLFMSDEEFDFKYNR